MRQHYSTRWKRTSSQLLTTNIRGEYIRFLSNLESARKSDGYVAKKFQDSFEWILKLSGSHVRVFVYFAHY